MINMSKKKYNKQLKEGNTNMNYDTWKLWNRLIKKHCFEYNTSWYGND